MRSSDVCTSSREEISPERTIAASSLAPRNIRSLSVTAPPRWRLAEPSARRLLAWQPTCTRNRATIWACPQGSSPRQASSSESECHERGHSTRGPVGPRRSRRLRHRDSRARQRGWRAALPRSRHRRPCRPGPLRAGLGPAGGRSLQTRPAAGRTARADRALGRPPRRRAVGAGDARAGVGLRPADRHHRRGGPRQPRARLGDGAVVRGAVRARSRPAAGAAGGDRPGANDPRALS